MLDFEDTRLTREIVNDYGYELGEYSLIEDYDKTWDEEEDW